MLNRASSRALLKVSVITKEAKQRKDSIEQFENASRFDLSEKEKYELSVIETYLPKLMSEDEITKIVNEVIESVGATGPSDMGKVMGKLMPKVKGKADGGLVNKIVKSKFIAEVKVIFCESFH